MNGRQLKFEQRKGGKTSDSKQFRNANILADFENNQENVSQSSVLEKSHHRFLQKSS